MPSNEFNEAVAKGKRTCAECGFEKGFVFSHLRGRTRCYRDENGGLWSGAVCNTCRNGKEVMKYQEEKAERFRSQQRDRHVVDFPSQLPTLPMGN